MTKTPMNKKSAKRFSNQITKIQTPMCNIRYCNVGCKDTILEKGKGSILPKALHKLKHQIPLDDLIKTRKEIFGEDTNVLDEDSFYKNINYLGTGKNKLSKKKLMKMGAISGCYSNIAPDLLK
jgi:hypothetical protein